MDENNNNYFKELYDIDVSGHTEDKNGLTYLSWAWAWAELKKIHPDATYKVYENADGWNYHTDRSTCWVKVGVTVCGIEHIEDLPVMDYKNKAVPFETITSVDVNKTIQRAITKAIGRHGLGLYIFAKQDMTEAKAEMAKALAEAKQELTDYLIRFDSKLPAEVWKKYKVDNMTDPTAVLAILDKYKEQEAAAKAKAKAKAEKAADMPEEV